MSADATVIDWAEPPAVSRGARPSKFDPVIEALKEKPGEWALVLEDVNSASARVFIKKGCEITTRSTGKNDGKVNVYARFPGDSEDTPASPSPVATERLRKRPAAKATKSAPKKAAATKARPKVKPTVAVDS